jgi:hypothetical protein
LKSATQLKNKCKLDSGSVQNKHVSSWTVWLLAKLSLVREPEATWKRLLNLEFEYSK